MFARRRIACSVTGRPVEQQWRHRLIRNGKPYTVSFVLVGVIEGNKPYTDSAKAELKDVRLTAEWQKHRIPLNGRDLSRIKTGFGWSLAGQGRPVTFYLDDIRYVP